jgi:hypothetical protein
MKGYPRHVATKRDFENLLADPEFRDRALAELQGIGNMKDDEATIDETPSKIIDGKTMTMDMASEERIIKTVANPSPTWKQKGFESRSEISDLIKSMPSQPGLDS